MKHLLLILLLCSWVFAQEPQKDLMTELFRRVRGGEAQVYVGELPPLIASLGLELDNYTVVGGFQETSTFEQNEQTQAQAYLSYKGNWQDAVLDLQSYFKTLNWKLWSINYLPVWGFANTTAFQSGDFCLDNQRFSFSFDITDLTKVSFFMEQIKGSNEMLVCPVSFGVGDAPDSATEATTEPSLGSSIPAVYLEAPVPSLVLVAENLPYGQPIPSGQWMGVDLPGGWASRTTLATTLSPARVLSHYENQMQALGWSKVQGGSTPLQEWSELELLENNQKWLGTLSVSYHEAYPGVVMPILIVLEKPN